MGVIYHQEYLIISIIHRIKMEFVKQYIPNDKVSEFDRFVKTNTPMQRIELLIKKSIAIGASDIHIEPLNYDEDDIKNNLLVRIRIRIGGELKFFNDFSKNDFVGFIKMGEDYDQYIRWIKLNLSLSGTDGTIPLDAAYSIKDESANIDVNLRFSFIPEGIELPSSVWYFPKIVIRILDNSKNIIDFNQINLLEFDKNEINRFLNQNQGFLVMAWPTGSGKTTTLYSMLQKINGTNVNIQTVEDPIEYKIPGINQSKINNKSSIPYTFALALKSILRQDPDIILIGETRDTETWKTALEAASTGHLVFTTLHANSSIEIYSRLIQMGIEKYQVVNGVNIWFSQRLMRKVCPHCSVKHKPDEKLREEFKKTFQGYDYSKLTCADFTRIFGWKMTNTTAKWLADTYKSLKSDIEAKEYKLLDDKNNSIILSWIEESRKKVYRLNETVYKNLDKAFNDMFIVIANTEDGNTCEHCLGEGYLWRCPIFEVIPNTEELGELLLQNASKKELNKYVEKASIFTLKKYAFLLIMEWLVDFKQYSNLS